MADAFDQFQTLLRETIDGHVHDLILDDDDVGWSLIDTFQPEAMGGRNTDATVVPGWEASWRIKMQRAGRVSGGGFAGNTPTTMGKGDDLIMGQAADAKYLDPALTPLRSYLKLKMKLKRQKGSLTVNRQQIYADLASEPLDQISGDFLEDAIAHVRSETTNALWGDGSALIAQVNASAGFTVIETAGGVAVTMDIGSIFRFTKGQRYQAGSNVTVANYGASTRTKRGGSLDGVFRCVNIDAKARTVDFESEPGEGNIALSDNDAIMVEGMFDFTQTTVNAASLQAKGIEAWLINAGNFPETSLDVSNYSELKSWVYDNSSSQVPPTPELIAAPIDDITETGKSPPSVLIAQQSIWTLYAQLERQALAVQPVAQGATFRAGGSVSGPVLGHGDHAFARLSSARVRPNSIVGLSPDTWKKFMPIGEKAIQWFYSSGGVSGASGIFGPVYSGRQVTELLDAPFDFFVEFACTDPRRNFRILGVQSQRDV